ncbi:hypothetical protein, partial [Flavobacterium rakeshii]|uniref:hypothetical protein n=1 Tax=Flavobacterium rakeshii TaxID=1038845 RepID=UPI001E3B8C08
HDILNVMSGEVLSFCLDTKERKSQGYGFSGYEFPYSAKPSELGSRLKQRMLLYAVFGNLLNAFKT